MNLEELPEILKPNIEMNFPNEELCLYEGNFVINWKDKKFNSKGKVVFKWFPRLSIYFKGIFEKDFDYSIIQPFEKDLIVEINSEIPNFYAKGGIYRIRKDEEFNIVCILGLPNDYGQKEIDVDFVRFEIANLRSFCGSWVRNDKKALINRLVFENAESKIIIDKHENFIELNSKVEETGGFQLLYTGKLELKSKRKISFEKSSSILNRFSYFLQFINGRRCFPLFRIGFNGNKEIWKSITPFYNDPYKYVYSWASDDNNNGLEDIWKNFSELWKNEVDRECIKTILHWYTEANSNSAFLEGSIVLIQNALELLFHWLISEKMNFINSNEADNLSASAKISFLLSFYQIQPSLPNEFESLPKYAKQNNIINGPESLTRIRNCIVHPSLKNEKH
jgi:hypothetical protein